MGGHLVDMLNERCGTNRNYDGTLNTTKGRVESYDNIAASFVEAITPNNDNTTDNTADTATGAYYVHVMKKITDKGVGYVNEEMARLEKVLGAYLKTEKRRETNIRVNVLKYFRRLINKEEDPEEKATEDLTKSEEVEKKVEKKGGKTDDIVMGAIFGGKDYGTISKEDLDKSKNEL